MTVHSTHITAVTAPGPDDSDFLDSESERGINDSIVEQSFTHVGLDDMPSISQRSHEMTEMEAELAAVATPSHSQATTIMTPHLLKRHHPRPASKIMHMTSNFSFAYFENQQPQPDVLNQANGRESAGLPIDAAQQYLKRSTRSRQHSENGREAVTVSSIAPHLTTNTIIHWFSIDKELVYLSFFDDWGPLNVAMFYRFCLHLHHLIGMMQEIHLILYTTNQPRTKANAALLAAMYAMVCGDMTPADAYHPLSELELVPFRDAGYGRADFYLTVQDILYGVHRAVTEKLLDLMTFDLDEYETYEQVQNGDWNWVTPNIIAFASPNDKEYVAELRAGTVQNGRATPGLRRPLNATFVKTIQYFKEKNVRLVVRLNNPLYDSRVFEREGIQHVDMYFDDGSNPSDEIIRDFIQRANAVIDDGGAIAVHCKAGLGRTGVLIGAYLAYKHGFSASESIGFMRIMRPGCVVGPQQHFMYKECSNWIRWRQQDDAQIMLQQALEKQKVELIGTRRRKSDELEASSSNEGSSADSEVDAALGESENRQAKKVKRSIEEPCTPKKIVITIEEKGKEKNDQAVPTLLMVKPTPCVGQPRKSPSPSRKRAAQQAPATIARMGGLASSTKGRVLSGGGGTGSQRSFSGSSFTRAIQQLSQEEAKENDDDVNEQQSGPATPRSSSRVLGDARRINIQVSIQEEGGMAISAPRTDDWIAANQVKTSMTKEGPSVAAAAAAEARRIKSPVADVGLFTEGWKSPDPPAAYTKLMSQSPTARRTPTSSSVLVAPSTPTSPSLSLNQGARASPQVRERFGLREAGSHQGTPKNRKEAMYDGIVSSDSNGSSSSSSTSLTSRDAIGSEDEQLCAGPIDVIRSATKPAAGPIRPVVTAAPMDNTTSAIDQATIVKILPPASRTVSRERMQLVKPRVASNTSATSSRTASVTRPVTSTTTATSRRVVPTGRVPTATNKAGRVAAARDQLAQRQAAAQQPGDLAHRSSVKRSRVHSPDLNNGVPVDAKAQPPRPQTSAGSRTLVPSHIANRFGLGTSASGTIASVQVKTSSGAAVPRFAAATAASSAKSQHGSVVVDQTNRFQRGGPVHSVTASKPFNGSSTVDAHPTAVARLNGRNVRRRRSSVS
ncbi:hypothetical protein CBS101457_003830 [Exobasidium rhododendri]|nr:hypothetical protein CBS101457_003830 [Exobasidium rhododendri]